LPSFPLPLKGADEAVLVDLSAIVQGVCDRACSAISTTLSTYHLSIAALDRAGLAEEQREKLSTHIV